MYKTLSCFKTQAFSLTQGSILKLWVRLPLEYTRALATENRISLAPNLIIQARSDAKLIARVHRLDEIAQRRRAHVINEDDGSKGHHICSAIVITSFNSGHVTCFEDTIKSTNP